MLFKRNFKNSSEYLYPYIDLVGFINDPELYQCQYMYKACVCQSLEADLGASRNEKEGERMLREEIRKEKIEVTDFSHPRLNFIWTF